MQLDDRQHDILQEMGISLLERKKSPLLGAGPQGVVRAKPPGVTAAASRHPTADSSQAPHSPHAPHAPRNTGVPSASAATPQPAPSAPSAPTAIPALSALPDLTALGWSDLLEQAQHCQACSLGLKPKDRLFGLSSLHPTSPTPWPLLPATHGSNSLPKPSPVLILADAPQLNVNGQALAFAAISNPLFEQFLRAASWSTPPASGKAALNASPTPPTQEVMITHMVKCASPGASVQAQQVQTCLGYLRAQIRLLRPQVLLVMGRMAAQTLVQSTALEGLPHAKLCGRLLSFEGTPMVVTQPPEYLWRSGQDKAKSWSDLCLALSVLESTPS